MGIFSGVVDVISNAANTYFANGQRSGTAFPGEKSPQTMEDMLKALADMGFTNKELNKKVIKEKGGRLTDDVIEAIMRST